MVSRRRLLLSYLANSFKYLPYSYEYLYYGLVPTTIDGKQVRNKAKVSKLYGNSVMENQQLKPTAISTTSGGITITNNNNGTFTLSSGTTSSLVYYAMYLSTDKVQPIQGHTYLLFTNAIGINGTSGFTIGAFGNYIGSGKNALLFTVSTINNTDTCVIRIANGTSVNAQTLWANVIDLTQKYPFNTPTTLTDNRVQAIINRGYIQYNLGELKSVDIGDISSEPYNLFDEDNLTAVHKYVNSSNGVLVAGNNNNYAEEEYIKVVGGKSYSFSTKYQASAINNLGVGCYDKDKNFIIRVSLYSPNAYNSFTLPTNCEYVRISFALDVGETVELSNNQICLHLTGTRTGYAPYQAPQTIPFKYQGSGVGTAHDTYELTKTAHVFTKNMSRVDLSTITFTHDTTNNIWWNIISNMANGVWNVKPNILSSKYETYLSRYSDELSSVDKICTVWSTTNRLIIKDTSIAQSSDITGTLQYQLATPQVITIPRKHLGIVDLGSLNWNYDSTNNRFISSQPLSGSKIVYSSAGKPQFACSKYITIDLNHFADMTISQYTNGNIYIKDTQYANATDFKNAMSGVLLFYETENEVADITDTFDIQSGGTINTDSNVLPNADFLMKCK